MRLHSLLREAQREILVLGTTPIAGDLAEAAAPLAEVSARRDFKRLRILYESNDELYRQSLILQEGGTSGTYYADLVDRRDDLQALKTLVLRETAQDLRNGVADKISIEQVTLRLPLNVLKVDDLIWISFVSERLSGLDSYLPLPSGHPWRERVESYLAFHLDPAGGGRYLFDPERDKQLIQMYDLGDEDSPPKPRGDAPRKVFYDNSDIQRRSVWGFAFARDGRLLLHQRSHSTGDNRGMWDKSFGGHVDTGEDSVVTAKRELVEEFFLEAAEDTTHLQEDVGLVQSVGDWAPLKGAEGGVYSRVLREAYEFLPNDAWLLFTPRFRKSGEYANRIIHPSVRLYHVSDTETEWRTARFIADTYFVVAPASLKSEAELREMLIRSDEGAAIRHDLVDVRELIETLSSTPLQEGEYTEDLYHFMENYRTFVLRFSNFVNRVFGS